MQFIRPYSFGENDDKTATDHRLLVFQAFRPPTPSLQTDHLMLHKKLSYCWYRSRYDKISDSARSANPNRNHDVTYVNFISLTE